MILKFLKTLDRRIIFLFMAIAVILPTITGQRFPVQPSPMTDDFASVLKELKSNDTVLLSADYDPGSQAELQPMTLAFMKYCFDNNIKVVTMALWPLGSKLIESALNHDRIYIPREKAIELMSKGKNVYVISKKRSGAEEKIEKRGNKYIFIRDNNQGEESILNNEDKYYVKGLYSIYDDIKYGVDYLDIGYKVGGLVVIQGIVNDFEETVKTDTLNNKSVLDYPITRNIKNLKDFSAVFTISSGNMGIKEWVVYGNGPTGVKVLSGVTAVSAPEFLPYLTSKQLSGLLAGLAGAAEFEAATNYYEGEASKGMTPQSYAHLVIIFFILLGNGVYITEKYFIKE
ncbi:MAG: hypothetical protein M0R46_03895 [Candidatus Muirbacterium halophilum]|nr:hypothetical protein [Candidatus Muirbacterium halophilum]MCK9475034.1 hypothetical protein [Candidatus Muirbacterium halophilum]